MQVAGICVEMYSATSTEMWYFAASTEIEVGF